jgi:C4-dicarboxylate-binding protein DctP
VTKAMGAVPVPMDFAELYMALSRKVVDGQHNPFSHIVGSKFYEVQKYVSLLPYGLPPHIVTLSKKAWGRLNAEQQEIVMAAAKETAIMLPALGLAQEKEYIDLVKSKGMIVAEEKDIDLDAFLKIFYEVCVPQLKDAYGPKWVEAIVNVK